MSSMAYARAVVYVATVDSNGLATRSLVPIASLPMRIRFLVTNMDEAERVRIEAIEGPYRSRHPVRPQYLKLCNKCENQLSEVAEHVNDPKATSQELSEFLTHSNAHKAIDATRVLNDATVDDYTVRLYYTPNLYELVRLVKADEKLQFQLSRQPDADNEIMKVLEDEHVLVEN
jgi:hypothetical protein